MVNNEHTGADNQHPEKHILRVPQVARLLRKTKRAIYLMVERGQLPYIRRGRELYFYKDEILAVLDAGRQVGVEDVIQRTSFGSMPKTESTDPASAE
jgi:excisionase family DNA binding protein